MKSTSEQKQNRITVDWDSYNHRRYSKPWIAKVVAWDGSEKPELEWGLWFGTDDDGGVTEIYATEGDIIRWGQKDYRKIHHSVNKYGIVCENSEIEEITPARARQHWLESRLKMKGINDESKQ